jgi:hypothetical protein
MNYNRFGRSWQQQSGRHRQSRFNQAWIWISAGFWIFSAFLLVAFLSALVMYVAWNWGLVGAVTFAKPIAMTQAFWLTCLPSTLYVSFRKND